MSTAASFLTLINCRVETTFYAKVFVSLAGAQMSSSLRLTGGS